MVSKENISRVGIESSSIMLQQVLARSLCGQMLFYFVILGHALALDGYQHQQHGKRTTRRDVSCQKRIGEYLDAEREVTREVTCVKLAKIANPLLPTTFARLLPSNYDSGVTHGGCGWSNS